MPGLHSSQSAVKSGVDGSDLFKKLLQGVKAAGSPHRETLPSTGSSCDESASDLTVTDANEKTDVQVEIPDEIAVCNEAPPVTASLIDSVPVLPKASDASLVNADVPHVPPKRADGEKFSVPDLNKSKHAKKSWLGEEQVEAKTAANNSSLAAVCNTGTNALIVAAQQSIPRSRVATHAERNDATASKALPVAVPVGNAKEHQPPPMNMTTGVSGKAPDLVLSGSREFGADVEAETHDMEPVTSTIPHPALSTTVATVNVTLSDAVTFQPFLFRSDRHADVIMRSENDMAAAGAEVPNQTAAAQPIKRLELQWNDSSLGEISLTAELRDGALHAVVDNSRTATGVDATDLHRFLEENHVPLHALQVNGQPTVFQTSRDASWNSPATGVATGMGGSQSSSHHGQDREDSSARVQRRAYSKTERYEGAMQIVEGSTAIPRRQSDQRLSIHI